MTEATIGDSGHELSQIHRANFRYVHSCASSLSYWVLFGLLALGTLTLPASLFGKSAMLIFLVPIAAVATLINAWAWGLWPRQHQTRLAIELAAAVVALCCYLFLITRTLAPGLVSSASFLLIALLFLLWATRPFLATEKHGRVLQSAIGVSRFVFCVALALLSPWIIATLLSVRFFPHIIAAGQDEAYRFTIWPSEPPSLVAIVVFAGLHLYAFLVAAVLAWCATHRLSTDSPDLRPALDSHAPSPLSLRGRAIGWQRVAIACSALYVVFMGLHALRYDVGWRSLLWPLGGPVAHVKDVGTIWAPYDWSKSWVVGNRYLTPGNWRADILLATSSVDQYQAVALYPKCAREPQATAGTAESAPGLCPRIRRVILHVWGGERAPAVEIRPDGELRCARAGALDLDACWSQQGRVPGNVETPTHGYRARWLSAPRFDVSRKRRMDKEKQSTLEAASHYYKSRDSKTDFLAQCHQEVCTWMFFDGRTAVEVEFLESELPNWRSIVNSTSANLEEFKKAAE